MACSKVKKKPENGKENPTGRKEEEEVLYMTEFAPLKHVKAVPNGIRLLGMNAPLATNAHKVKILGDLVLSFPAVESLLVKIGEMSNKIEGKEIFEEKIGNWRADGGIMLRGSYLNGEEIIIKTKPHCLTYCYFPDNYLLAVRAKTAAGTWTTAGVTFGVQWLKKLVESLTGREKTPMLEAAYLSDWRRFGMDYYR